jgi:uncharacterized protein (TIGR03382 family)
MRTKLLLLGVLGLTSSASALNQSKHRDTSVAACRAAGLPKAFCLRVGVETYNVDANEFNDLSAHSQIPDGSTACDAANNSSWRVFWLGSQLRAATIGAGYSPSRALHNQIAQHMGRALHTIQDNCAHSGMPNPQHAWHSLSDVCQGTTESPDVNPAAYTCAAEESAALFSAFIDVLHDYGGETSQLSNITSEDDTHYPAYGDVCDFLGSADQWDGSDRRWDNNIMRPMLTAQLLAGLGGASDSQWQRVCTTWENDVAASYSDPDFDTSGGPQSCIKIHAFCLGKADAASNAVAPPWEPEPAPSATVQGGCSAAGGHGDGSPAAALLLVAVLLALAVRNRVL